MSKLVQLTYVSTSMLSVSDITELVSSFVDIVAVAKYICDSAAQVETPM